jgi:Domain of unknown function DUF302
MLTTSYTLSATTPLAFADAVGRVRAELQAEGFGVLCEIDVQATLREKLGVEGEPYLILGACNPPLAHQAPQTEPDLGRAAPVQRRRLPAQRRDTDRGGRPGADALDRRQRRARAGGHGRQGPARRGGRACRRRLSSRLLRPQRTRFGAEKDREGKQEKREELTEPRRLYVGAHAGDLPGHRLGGGEQEQGEGEQPRPPADQPVQRRAGDRADCAAPLPVGGSESPPPPRAQSVEARGRSGVSAVVARSCRRDDRGGTAASQRWNSG